jgi:hypothetical protein
MGRSALAIADRAPPDARRAAPARRLQKKRVKGARTETYRDRWLKRLPRKSGASWLSGVCSVCEHGGAAGGYAIVPCAGPCLRSFHPSCAPTRGEVGRVYGQGPYPQTAYAGARTRRVPAERRLCRAALPR